MKKAIWYTLGWQWLGLRAQVLMWIGRWMYRLHLINKDTLKEYVDIVSRAALTKKVRQAGLEIKSVNEEGEKK